MHLLSIVVVLVAVLFAIVSFAAPPEEDAGSPAAPAPAPEMKFLRAWEGTWDAEVEMMGQKEKGVEVCRGVCGGFWVDADFNGSFMGAPFQGRGLYGYDVARGKIVTVWVDSSGSPLTIAEGSFSKDGKTLTSTASGMDMTGKPGTFTHETVMKDHDTRVFTITQDGAGEMMRITYRRQRTK